MRCEDIKGIMGALADGEVAPHVRSEAEAHIKSCAACRAEHSAQLAVKSLLASLPQEDAPAFLMTRVMAQIKERKGVKSPAKLRWAYSSAAALLLVVVFVVGGMLMPHGNNDVYTPLEKGTAQAYTPTMSGELTPASFGDFVQQRHDDVRDSLRVHREFSPGLENAVIEIKGSDGIYKELPEDKDKDEEAEK